MRSRSTSISSGATPRRASDSSYERQDEVDWQQLERNEQQEKEDKLIPEGAEDESTKFLLARLEQENALLASDPKTHATRPSNTRLRSQSRPPSIAHLKKLVKDREAPSIRYSMASSGIAEESTMEILPSEPPPMTELEFWAALVQDYPSTASRLPTLTTSKIRSGIPPPLRGVVWTSMAGARDKHLEMQFEKLLHEKSPYEGIINKDVGRSFPGVELFRDAEGEGQKMLGRVLNCFSLQDRDIGYCQGLGFLVGPLLMNMGERDAFCVLVRLMDNFALRPSFLPSLSGLHMRIFQFSSLLDQHHPALSQHFNQLGVEPAYLSQWFLSCFAVTCPLPMLFRIYDVIFAEGANETVMRVALALMRRNEPKMMEATEFEEVMQLLLGRGIWDVYGCNADDLVDDFTSLGNIITHERLAELEREFESKDAQDVGKSAGFLPDVQAAASRFLGRLWAPSHNASKSTSTLSPSSAEKDASSGVFRGSFLRRSPSKQSISTLNDSEGASSNGSGSASLASTAPTELETNDSGIRVSSADTLSLKSKAESTRTVSVTATIPPTPTGFASSKEQQDLHSQIEDLLTALSEMQREHAQLAAMLQKEREDRSEDHRVVRQLVGRLQVNDSADKLELKEERRRTMPPAPKRRGSSDQPKTVQETVIGASDEANDDGLAQLVDRVDNRLRTNNRISASFETKAQLKSSLVRTREQLEVEQTRARDLDQQLEASVRSQTSFELEAADLRDQVADLRVRVNVEFKERQRLEHVVCELRAESRKLTRASTLVEGSEGTVSSRVRNGSVSSAPVPSGLREFKLGRSDSSSSIQTPPVASHKPSPSLSVPTNTSEKERAVVWGRRTSSLATQQVLATPEHEPANEDALLVELVTAKTGEATARQEIDELKRSLNIQKRRHDEEMSNMQLEMANALAQAQAAARSAQAEAEATRSASTSLTSTPAVTPAADDASAGAEWKFGEESSASLPEVKIEKTKTAPASGGGGWFWSRRTPSTSTVIKDP
ncbi:hypothetical protein K431DRAFT_215041 [Polychaeton citri CBS 116435]|uniref:Rab-GAP TBC domain-containing protein n=1 Tax=Polychaeton citri CBS 116435 TaxID=1314669 RepID=A0A9P4UUH8_9PEZI|nr:hypothetical protein K431DRAFT_215041 [Polychaeton citri CBS 116435]